ncbi:MAG: hypothetical protein J1F31_03045 [Erysipelotrichales bacterium]|nr:hypothetical protein [Erysipelotrichales bacterium]
MKIGIVLGGGFARGSAQAGFIKGMLPYINKGDIELLSCTSIGALNGIALSIEKLDYMEQVYRTSNFYDMKNLKLNLKNRLVESILSNLISDCSQLHIPLYITGTCLNTLSTHYFYIDETSSYEDVSKVTNITVTFPFVNGVYRKEYKRFYLDGGATDNIPILPFLYRPVDLLIILHCYPKYLPPINLIESNMVVVDIDVTARCPNTISTYSFQKDNLNKMFDDGVKYGEEFGKRILTLPTLEEIKLACQAFMREEIEIRKKKKAPLNAAIFFNRLQQTRDLQ